MEVNYANIVLKRVSIPPLNTVVFNIENDVLFPCIVKSGRFYANGRLSNFWEWYNLYTKKEESGYGHFFIPVEMSSIAKEENNGLD